MTKKEFVLAKEEFLKGSPWWYELLDDKKLKEMMEEFYLDEEVSLED